MNTTDPILSAASRFLQLRYGHPTSRSDTSCVDCSTLTAHTLDEVYGPFTVQEWNAAVVADGSQPWSPIRLVVDRLRGREIYGAPPPDSWSLVQGWKVLPGSPSTPPAGHSMIARYTGTGFQVLEAQRGVGVHWRGIPRPATRLVLADAPVLQWDALLACYPAGLRIAVLPEVR